MRARWRSGTFLPSSTCDRIVAKHLFIMSYPPPPGLKASSTSITSVKNPSLPPRPISAAAPLPSFKSVYSSNSSVTGPPGFVGGNPSSTYGGFSTFAPRAVRGGASSWSGSSHVVSAGPTPPTGYTAPTTYSGGNFQSSTLYQQPPSQQYQQQSIPDYNGGATPQILNPFP